jgi:hypothetical protein
MPQREDDNTTIILNMIFERQIKRAAEYIYLENQQSFLVTNLNQDLFVISAADPNVILDYASVSRMNNTLDSKWEPEDLEYCVLIVLDYIAFLHRVLHLVNLDIKP